VTVENVTAGSAITTASRPDGSFFTAIPAASGDTIRISATDGYSSQLEVE
jgi:hypothetical protein